ncbi:MAG: proton-conducting transporter membrane subunit [Thermonemataceae bacterium]|nr:proton-conducting transporter membrane subunit [Thermonemataceae bacterium]
MPLIFLLSPLAAFFIILLAKEHQESLISKITYYSTLLVLLSIAYFIVHWLLLEQAKMIFLPYFHIYESEAYQFTMDLYFDKIVAVYLLVGMLLIFLIVKYSTYYMHLEKGYRRFFAVMVFFIFSYNLTIMAGNFETLFVGWEMLGISSFLLRGFYRERYLPIKNAVKVFSIYRIGDIGIILAMWASHHLWFESVSFLKLQNYELVELHLAEKPLLFLFVSVMLLVAAAAKSGQFPFSSWVPRAMEGPTPSSAIFYGSLSIHLGVFLLLRTHLFWSHILAAKIIIAFVGAFTALSAYFISQAQATIKTQVAYASITQIGLMFVEIALGWYDIVLIHFVGNAFLRTYQLLISPSVVAYLIREQFYNFTPPQQEKRYIFGKRIAFSLYSLSLLEFNLDNFMSQWVFMPFKKIGSRLNFLSPSNILYFFVPMYAIGIIALFMENYMPLWLHNSLPIIFASIALLMVMKGFSERRYPRLAWLLLMLQHFWIALAVSHNEHFDFSEVIWYLSGVLVAGIFGFVVLQKLRKKEPKHYNLYSYHGHAYEHSGLATLFFLAALGLMGFPISSTFIGEDLIFSHIHEHQVLLAFILSACFVIEGIAIIRIYARLFLGRHSKAYHETPLQSS